MLPSTTSTVVARIRAYAVHQGWTKSRLASEAGLPDTTLRHFDRGSWNPTLDTLRKLEAIIPRDFQAGDTDVAPVAPADARDRTTPAERAAAVATQAAAHAEATQAIDEARQRQAAE